jgi:hypothetical protein
MSAPKALTLHRTLVPRADRDRYFERLRRKREHYTGASCRFWVFEEAALPGAFIEFFEADDPDALARAHAGAPERVLDAARVYTQVEFD